MTAADEGEQAGGLSVQLSAAVGAALGRVADALERRERAEQGLWANIHTVPIAGAIEITSSAGTGQSPNTLGPNDPYWWDVLYLNAWGFSAGQVDVRVNDPLGELVGSITTAGVPLNTKGTLPLSPRDNLVFVASGITLASGYAVVRVGGRAVEVASPYWPVYLT